MSTGMRKQERKHKKTNRIDESEANVFLYKIVRNQNQRDCNRVGK